MGRRRSRRTQLATCGGKSLRDLGKFQSQQRRACGEHEVEARGHKRLMTAVNFTKASFRAIAMNGVAHGSARGDHAYARSSVGRLSGTNPPGQEKSPAVDAAALLTHGTKVEIAP